MSAAHGVPTGSSRRTVAAVTAVLVAGVLAACTDDSDSSSDQPGEGGTVSELLPGEPAEQVTRVRKVWGEWPAGDSAQTRSLEQATGKAVGAWLDGGFVAVDYPTRDFDEAFSAFTSGAAAEAQKESWLTTNRTLGGRLIDAVPVRRTVTVTAFAPSGSPVGATADVNLVLRGVSESGRRSELSVTGEVYLTRSGGKWRIFGYDLQRSVRAPGSRGSGGGGR